MIDSSSHGDAARVLAVNAGSSSIRFVLYDVTEPLLPRLNGKIERIGLLGTTLTVDDSNAFHLPIEFVPAWITRQPMESAHSAQLLVSLSDSCP